MKVFTCDDHKGYWPVPTASVVIAKNEKEAHEMLKKELKETHGIEDDDFTLKELNPKKRQVEVLSNGDY